MHPEARGLRGGRQRVRVRVMKLADLNPQLLCTGGSGVRDSEGNAIPVTHGVGITFDCPCGNHDEAHRCYVPFANPIGPGPHVNAKGWQRTGDTFETLTLSPSIQRIGDCRWHGFIRNGEVTTV
jgi:Family of unknown function (DUF6527)